MEQPKVFFLSYPRCSVLILSPFPPPLHPIFLPILRFTGVTITLRQSNSKSLLHSEFVGRQQQPVLQCTHNGDDAEDQTSVLSYLFLDGRVRVHNGDFGAGDGDDYTLSHQYSVSEDVMQVLEKVSTGNQ